jgi:hypothetical protein
MADQIRNLQMKTLACAALLLTLAVPAFAAPSERPGPMMGQGSMMGDDRGMGMMRGMCPMGMGQHTDGVLAFLKTELRITPAQNAAWEAFGAAYRETKGHGGQMPMMPGGMMMGGGTDKQSMPDRMAQHAKMMEDHLAQMKKMQGPVTQLYAALNTEQKRTADELLPRFMMCRMM